MSDALLILRNTIMAGGAIAHEEGHYKMGPHRFPEATKTSFKRTLARSEDYYYTLRDIMFFREHATSIDYRRRVMEAKLVAVVEQDRATLQQYLEGKIDSCPQINISFQRANGGGLPIGDSDDRTKRDIAGLGAQSKSSTGSGTTALGVAAVASSGAVGGHVDDAKQQRKTQKRKSVSGDAEQASVGKDAVYQDRQLLKKLREGDLSAASRSAVFRAANNTDFRSVLKVFNDVVLKPVELKEAAAAAQKKNEAAGNGAQSNSRKTPIIVVPSAITSCITPQNARELLIDGVYVSPGDRQALAGAQRMRELVINRPILPDGSGGFMYKVIDDASKLSAEDWTRVVAVFVTGQKWQFANWKYSNPAELFQMVLGIHITEGDVQSVDVNVKSWNCRVLKVTKNKQHLNSAAMKAFWLSLDQFVSVRKPHLMTKPRQYTPSAASSAGR